MEVHVTELEVFRTCRLYWHYSYRERLKPVSEPEKVGGPLWIGTGIHYALAQFYSSGTHPREALQRWPEYQGVSLSLMEEILDHYYEAYQRDLQNWEVLSVETPRTVPIPGTQAHLTGTFDLLIRERRDGSVWVVDHKTRTAFDSLESLEMNEQATAYTWLSRQVGLPVKGVIWNEIKKASPRSNPRVTEYFRRSHLFRSLKELEQFERDLVATVQEMTSDSLAIYPNLGHHCTLWSCSYRILCRARRQGSDVEAIKSALYLTLPG
jgi:hypothetical protein